MHETVATQNKILRAYLLSLRQPQEAPEAVADHLSELEQLCLTFGVEIIGSEAVPFREAHARFLIGDGKAREISQTAQALNADVIIFDDDLSPSQQRNWEKLTERAVIDRREVILGIFADRAQTKEARLQVELARAEYSLPRLTRAWTHLERQRGGTGNRGGAGESQLEVDRRLLRTRIEKLKRDLKHVRQVRSTQRQTRLSVPIPTVALVGYTNAGKSSLLNAFTGAGVYVADQLFATLDPTTRRITLPNNQPLLVTDTVGFVRKLPHTLVEAFKATLEEAVLASVLLHVVDASQVRALDQRVATETVLEELGARDKPTILVLNKLDRLSPDERATLGPLMDGYEYVVPMSAHTGEGMEKLMDLLCRLVPSTLEFAELALPAERGDLHALVHREGHVEQEDCDEVTGTMRVRALLPPRAMATLREFAVVAGIEKD